MNLNSDEYQKYVSLFQGHPAPETPLILNPVELYVDGGLVSRNPAILGGTWAAIYLNESNEVFHVHSGLSLPEKIYDIIDKKIFDKNVHLCSAPFEAVTNNISELLAMFYGLETLPDDWKGTIYSDSECTIARTVSKTSSMKGVPDSLVKKFRDQQDRLWPLKVEHLDGHASQAEMKAAAKDGVKHHRTFNHIADETCTTLKLKYRDVIREALESINA